MQKVLKYTGLAVLGGALGLLTVTVLVFLFSIAIPLPLTEEQRAEISAYAPDENGVSVFQTEFWRAGHDANITVTEIIMIERQGNQVTVDRYWYPHMSWDVARTIRERRLRRQMEDVAPQITL